MSFIYNDPKLIKQLVEHGLEFEKKFLKKGQTVPDPASPPPDMAALQNHIKQLQAQLRPPDKDPNAPAVGSQSGNDVSLDVTHLKNLGTLIAWLVNNQIVIDGKRVAYAANENVQDPSYQLYKLEGPAVADTRDPKAQNVQYNYRVNKDLLVAYVNSVQAHAAQNHNPILNVQLQNIIQQANDQLDANINATYKDSAKTLTPDKVVDNVPQNIQTQEANEDGNIPLTFGDISSQTAFNAWIQKNNIFVDGKNWKTLQYDTMLTALYKRAQDDAQRANSEDKKLTATVYVAQIPKLAQMFNVTLGTGGASTTSPQEGQGGTAQPSAPLAELIGSLPLSPNQIDFGRIRRFIELYRSTALASTDPNRRQQASTMMDSAEKYMQAATQNTLNQSITNFPVNGLSATDLVRWAIPPTAGEATRSQGSAQTLASMLLYTVDAVANLVRDLYNAHPNEWAANTSWLHAIEQQAGGDTIPYGSSIAASNIDDINIARNNLSRMGT
jgi:hypothetical protein